MKASKENGPIMAIMAGVIVLVASVFAGVVYFKESTENNLLVLPQVARHAKAEQGNREELPVINPQEIVTDK